MTPQQVLLVQRSFPAIAPVAEQVGGLFYARLFELDPDLRHLFSGEMAPQSRKLIEMLAAAVHLLDQPDRLLPVLRQLGARHVAYGVREADYATVGAALIWTLRQAVGETFTGDLEAAWVALYDLVARTMQAGAREQAA